MRQKLRQARTAKGMSYRDVATIVGITERAYRYIENGERGVSLGVAYKLEDLFGIKSRELLVQDCNTDSSNSSAMEQATTA
ncbi:helix-turn-helix transcriptional regulator [Fodinisporobacter ferrooxydans]|uniref:Helix-turn-helix transcriptional regulator n=1 Tax=Fodinisporobacter ferrooxydans TaxID=2901836 RepID=A0ABY4CSJ3_9BACL|nr:helix-turn-helix transcriptional regulator [Alicyclobacillaceae bacterium MYW30-H2]